MIRLLIITLEPVFHGSSISSSESQHSLNYRPTLHPPVECIDLLEAYFDARYRALGYTSRLREKRLRAATVFDPSILSSLDGLADRACNQLKWVTATDILPLLPALVHRLALNILHRGGSKIHPDMVSFAQSLMNRNYWYFDVNLNSKLPSEIRDRKDFDMICMSLIYIEHLKSSGFLRGWTEFISPFIDREDWDGKMMRVISAVQRQLDRHSITKFSPGDRSPRNPHMEIYRAIELYVAK
jgi:hypothetical protein